MSGGSKVLSSVCLAWERFWVVCSVLMCEGGESNKQKTALIFRTTMHSGLPRVIQRLLAQACPTMKNHLTSMCVPD